MARGELRRWIGAGNVPPHAERIAVKTQHEGKWGSAGGLDLAPIHDWKEDEPVWSEYADEITDGILALSDGTAEALKVIVYGENSKHLRAKSFELEAPASSRAGGNADMAKALVEMAYVLQGSVKSLSQGIAQVSENNTRLSTENMQLRTQLGSADADLLRLQAGQRDWQDRAMDLAETAIQAAMIKKGLVIPGAEAGAVQATPAAALDDQQQADLAVVRRWLASIPAAQRQQVIMMDPELRRLMMESANTPKQKAAAAAATAGNPPDKSDPG